MGKMFVIIALIFTLLSGAMRGHISGSTIAFILVIAILLASLPRKMGILLTLLAFFLPLYLFMKEYRIGFGSFLSVLLSLLPLLIMLYGLYLMFHSLFGKDDKKNKTKSIFPF